MRDGEAFLVFLVVGAALVAFAFSVFVRGMAHCSYHCACADGSTRSLFQTCELKAGEACALARGGPAGEFSPAREW